MKLDQTSKLQILCAQCGDEQAMESLLKTSLHPLQGFLDRVVEDRALAEDILQDVLVLIVKKIGQLNEPAHFRSWMFRIAIRHAMRVLKKHRRWPKPIDSDIETTDTNFENLERLERSEQIPQILRSAPPASRIVIELHYLQEISLADIAKILDLPLGTVKSRLSYGLKKIRETQNLERNNS